jgi:hypothetical protein
MSFATPQLPPLQASPMTYVSTRSSLQGLLQALPGPGGEAPRVVAHNSSSAAPRVFVFNERNSHVSALQRPLFSSASSSLLLPGGRGLFTPGTTHLPHLPGTTRHTGGHNHHHHHHAHEHAQHGHGGGHGHHAVSKFAFNPAAHLHLRDSHPELNKFDARGAGDHHHNRITSCGLDAVEAEHGYRVAQVHVHDYATGGTRGSHLHSRKNSTSGLASNLKKMRYVNALTLCSSAHLWKHDESFLRCSLSARARTTRLTFHPFTMLTSFFLLIVATCAMICCITVRTISTCATPRSTNCTPMWRSNCDTSGERDASGGCACSATACTSA